MRNRRSREKEVQGGGKLIMPSGADRAKCKESEDTGTSVSA